jgi:hypothetical protein
MEQVDKAGSLRQDEGVIRTEHGTAADHGVGGLLEVIWSTRRAAAFDEACRRR